MPFSIKDGMTNLDRVSTVRGYWIGKWGEEVQVINSSGAFVGAGAGVSSLNGLTGVVTLSAGSNITLTPVGNDITISASGGSGSGDVTGPGSSTDNAISRFDGTTGKIIQNSGIVISDANVVTGAASLIMGSSSTLIPLQLYRDDVAGASTNPVRLLIGNKNSLQGDMRLEFINDSAAADPIARWEFAPRNNADSTQITAAMMEMRKQAGSDNGEIYLFQSLGGTTKTILKSRFTSTSALLLGINPDTGSFDTTISNEQTQNYLRIQADSGGPSVIFFGSAHPTGAGNVGFYTGASRAGAYFSTGQWEIGDVSGGSQRHRVYGAMDIGQTTLLTAVAAFRDDTAGASTNTVRLKVGTKTDDNGDIRLEYINAAASGTPGGRIEFAPRNNANSGAITAAKMEFYKASGADRGEFYQYQMYNGSSREIKRIIWSNSTTLQVRYNAPGVAFNTELVQVASARYLGLYATSSAGSGIVLYGSSYSGTPSRTEFYNASSLRGYISSAGLWVIGTSGGTQDHLINGNLNLAATGAIKFQDTTGGEYVGFKAPGTVGSSHTYTLPSALPAATTILSSDSSGNLAWIASTRSIGITIDGGGSAITTGVKGYIEVPFSGTITGWTIVGDTSGSIVVDVWKDTYANFPPTVADTIAGSEKPTISSATKGQDLSLSTWTTSVTAGDVIGFNVDSCTSITRATLIIRITPA